MANLLKIILPLTVTIGKTKPKKISLSMNWYRNAKFYEISNVKRKFQKIVAELLINEKPLYLQKVNINYKLYFPDKRERDIGNFGAVIDKFLEDALVRLGYLKGDCFKCVKLIKIEFGGIDKNARCEVEIDEIS
jgi:hypothetical protein